MVLARVVIDEIHDLFLALYAAFHMSPTLFHKLYRRVTDSTVGDKNIISWFEVSKVPVHEGFDNGQQLQSTLPFQRTAPSEVPPKP